LTALSGIISITALIDVADFEQILQKWSSQPPHPAETSGSENVANKYDDHYQPIKG